jgi:hypothetical protein
MSQRARILKESGEAIFALLKLTSASADAFPPLKSAATGALYIADTVLVCRYACGHSVSVLIVISTAIQVE